MQGDPLKDISELERVRWVMNGGKVTTPSEARPAQAGR